MQSLAFLPPTPIAALPLRAASLNALASTQHHQKPSTPIPRRTRPTASLPPLSTLIERAKADTNILLSVTAKTTATLAVIALLSLPLDASAASRGGRIGGSSFRSAPPSRSYSSPRSYSPSYGPSYYGPSLSPFSLPGMYVSPFIMPGGFGLGGFGSVFLLATAAAFVFDSLRTRTTEIQLEDQLNPQTAIGTVKVALLSNARQIQVKLDTLARSADTSTIAGLQYVLSETATSLLRSPDFWTHGSIDIQSTKLSAAESLFEETALQERLKIDEETLTNTRGMRRDSARASQGPDMANLPGEYIVVSFVVASGGSLITKLPKNIDSTNDLTRALKALAAVSRDDLQGVEIIWAPQSLRDVLTERELLQDHPELRRV